MKINFGKTKYLTPGFKEDIITEGIMLKNVKSNVKSNSKYLGSKLQKQGETEMQGNGRVATTGKGISALNSIMEQ